jgi:hypothetical protein
VQFHSDRRPLQERVSAVLSSVCHRADASRNITARTEARNDHTQQPRATTTRNNHTQRPHATTARNDHTQQPRATTARNNQTRRPHATTTRNNHTQRPHATTTRNNHTQQPHASTARHDCTQSPRITACGAHPGRAHTMANYRPPPDPSHKTSWGEGCTHLLGDKAEHGDRVPRRGGVHIRTVPRESPAREI